MVPHGDGSIEIGEGILSALERIAREGKIIDQIQTIGEGMVRCIAFGQHPPNGARYEMIGCQVPVMPAWEPGSSGVLIGTHRPVPSSFCSRTRHVQI
jgi:hypothetical protein